VSRILEILNILNVKVIQTSRCLDNLMVFCTIFYFAEVILKATGLQTDPNVPAVYFCCLRKQHNTMVAV